MTFKGNILSYTLFEMVEHNRQYDTRTCSEGYMLLFYTEMPACVLLCTWQQGGLIDKGVAT